MYCVLISENTILNKKNIGEGSHTVTVLEKRSSSCTVSVCDPLNIAVVGGK